MAADPSITYHFHPDAEGDNNRGWQVDHFEARLPDGKCVAYLKTARIPAARLETHYPRDCRFFAFAVRMRGWCGARDGLETGDKRKMILGVLGFCRDMSPAVSRETITAATTEEIEGRYFPLVHREIKRELSKEWAFFSSCFYSEPYVDFIRVHPDYQRRGIATNLYLLAGSHYAETGLRSSGCQRDEAAAVWTKMLAGGLVARVKVWGWNGKNKVWLDRLLSRGAPGLPALIVNGPNSGGYRDTLPAPREPKLAAA